MDIFFPVRMKNIVFISTTKNGENKQFLSIFMQKKALKPTNTTPLPELKCTQLMNPNCDTIIV